jgi:UDP-2-acetamido-2-deoxy-ribo-hexuluronate aminotransferase
VIASGNTSVYAQFTIQVEKRAEVQLSLKQKGIPTAVHYPIPLHLQPVLGKLHHPEGSFPASEHAAMRVISLPMHPYLTDADLVAIAAAVKGACR